MKLRLLVTVLFFVTCLWSRVEAQTCPTAAASIIEVCNNSAGNGTIRVYFTNGDAPSSYVLYTSPDFQIASEPIGPVLINTTIPLPPGAIAGVEFTNVPDGDYIVRGNLPGHSCPPLNTNYVIIGALGITVNSANALAISSVTVDPDCNPGSGGANADGQIDFTISGGVAPYEVTWTSTATSVPNSTVNTNPGNVTASAVDGGTYTVSVVDANNCTISQIINVPIATVPDAGADQTLCNVTSATLSANAPGAAEVGKWTVVSGTGVFTDDTNPNTTVSGLTIGASSTFEWTITDNNTPALCPGNSDQVTIAVSTSPTVANAGPDQTLCNTIANLSANTPTVGTGIWTIESGSGGTITSPSSPNSSFTGVAGNSYSLKWTISNGSCPPSEDLVTITLDANPTPANAGADQVICATSTTLAANVPATGTGTWSILAGTGGTIANPNSPTSGFSGTAGQTYTLSWSIANASCPPSSDNVTIQMDRAPTNPNAGSDQSFCGTTVALAANVPVIGTGAWSIVSGVGGNIANPANPVSGFTGVQGNSYVLRWTISNGSCPAKTDDVQITFNAAPTTANAGPNQTICLTSVTLAANTAATGTGAWTIVAGSGGVIAAPANPASGFTGTAGSTYTLRWTITNGVCPPSTDDVIISLNAQPTTPTAGPDQVICATSTSLAANAPVSGTGSWTIVGGTGGTITTPSSPTSPFTGVAGQTYLLNWTITNGVCTPLTDQVQIQMLQSPTVANAGPDQTLCNVTSATLAGNPPVVGTGTWTIQSGTGGSFANPSSPTSSFTGTAGQSYTLRWTISNGICIPQTDNVVITFDAAPTTPIAGTDQNVCGTSTALTGNVPSSGTGLWTIISGTGGTIATPSSATSTFTGTTGQTYVLQWTISNGSCAPLSDQVQIQFFAAPTVAVAGPDQSLCNVTSTTLAANTPTVGTGVWTIEAGAGGTITTPSSPTSTFAGNAGTVYVLKWTISNGTCTATEDQVSITFDAAPTAPNAGADQPVCATSTNLAANSPASGTGLWTIVSGTGGSITTPSSPSSAFSGVAGQTYVLEWTISNGSCAPLSDQVQIQFFAAPTVAAAGPDQSLCSTSATLAANTAAVGTGMWTIESGSGGVLADASNPLSAFTGTAGQTYTLRWTISNGACTPFSDDVQITMSNDATVANAGTDQTVCGSATLAGNTPASGTGLWTIVSGTGGSFTDAAVPTTTFTGPAGGSYTLRWTITNGACSTFDEVVISISPAAIAANAGADKTICGSANLEGNDPAPGTGLWTISAGTGGAFVDATSATTQFSGVAGTAYTLTWTVTSGACVSTDDAIITIDSNSPPAANAGVDEETCSTSTVLNANDPAPGTGVWSIISGTGGVIATPTNANSAFDGVVGQVYVLQWTISNPVIGCSPTSDQVTITFPDLPTVANAGLNQDICGTQATLAANTPTSGTGSWSVISGAGGSFSDAASPTSDFTGLAGETYELSWTIANACGTSSSSVFIKFDDTLSTPVAGTDQTVCGSAILAGNTPVIGTGSWSITGGTGGDIANSSDPATTFTGSPGVAYTLRWTITNGGCSAFDDVVITIDPDAPTPPNAGIDQNECGTSTVLAANTPVNGTGAWSVITGVGFSFSDTSSPTANFSGAAGTTYELRWRISSGCGFLDDIVLITFNDPPTTPNAGADKTVCGPTALEGNTPAIGTGLWTITSGTGGVLADATNPNSGFSGNGGTAYTLRWTVSSGACPAVSDDVQITFDSNSPTVSNAGPDQTVCGGTSTTLAGNTPVVGTGLWTVFSANGGTFSDDTNPASGFSGNAGETYILEWTITSATPACAASADRVTITFDNSAPVANAGLDQTVCGAVAALNASASSSSGTWSVVSGPGGIFSDENNAVADFTGAAGNVYVLAYTISSPCGDVSDEVTITLEENPTDAVAGPDKMICGTEQLEADPVVIGTGAWSIVGGAGGVFSDVADPNSSFTGIAGTVYTLRWTTSNGTCAQKTDEVQITIDINSPTIADAGPDQALCGTSTTLAANTAVSGTGAWTILSGENGTFTDASSPTSDFAGTASTSYILRWSISAVGCANPTVDDVRVQFDDVPSIANAGEDQQGCETTYTLAAAVPTSGSGSWAILSGTGGSFADPSDPATTFTGVNNQTYGLEWTVSNTCGTSVDVVSIIINEAPSTANAGADQVICGAVFANLAANTPASGNGFWSIVSGPGGSVVAPSSPTSQFIGTTGVSYTLRWVIANGLCTPSFDDVVINFSASPVATTPVTVCQNTVAPALVVTAAGATSFNWYYYSDPSDPLTKTLLPTTTASHTPGAELNTALIGSLTYEVEAVYGCGNSPVTQIVVNVSNTGPCGGGGGNCPALTAIPITPTLTTCADPDNGGLLFTLPGAYDVTIQNEIFKTNPTHPDAVNSTERGSTVDFDGLKAGDYFYTIKDLAGTVCVTDFTFTLERETIVELTSETVNENVTCFGAWEGSITLGAKGTTTGKYFYEFTHNGNTVSGEFTPGAPITGVPATDSQYLVIKLDETNLFSCPDTAMVRLSHLFPQITYSIAKTNVSECNGSDGSLTLSNVQGGNGAKQARLLKMASPDPVVIRGFEDVANAFPALSSGSYYVELRDENGCVVSSVDDPTVISAPGAVDFSVAKIADADCINNGKSGVISLGFTVPGNYLIGIGTSQVTEPATYVAYTYNDGDPAIFVDTLSRGSYFVFVKPATGNVCPSTRPTGEIEGAYAISFDVQRVCFAETQPSINLINVVGQPNAQMTVEVYRLSNLSEKVDEFTVPTGETISITYQGAPAGSPHTWLIQQDTYVIKAYQNQSFCPGEPTTPSHQVTYTATQPIALNVGNIKQSLPEPRHTGGFTLATITGGSPLADEDKGPYFIVSLLDPSSNTPILDDINVFRNAQGNYQHDFRNLPVGNYLVQVVDNNGCEATTIVIVPADTRILIPNIFTPNNDTVNDFFEVVNLPEGGNHKLVITNRWGKQIFSTGDYRDGNFWDADGEPDGIYFYRLQVAGEQTYTGWVEVLRGDRP